MTGKERIQKLLRHEKPDRIGVYEHLWDDTQKKWEEEGHIAPGQSAEDVFGFDIAECWPFNLVADLSFEPQVVAETEETITLLDGNGATLRRHKRRTGTPEHIGYRVTEREGWEQIRHLLTPDDERIRFAEYRQARERAHAAGRFFTCSSVNVFEAMHPVCGHVNLLMGMALDPEWVMEMAETYAKLLVELQAKLFEREGPPDAIWFYEDLGFKERPFMGPAMYEELLEPYHKYTIDYAKSLGLPVILHSCGYVEPLLAGMVRAGIDCLQAIEVKAGMDLCKLWREYGDRIAFMGGMDIRTLLSNDLAVVDAELEAKIPVMKEGFNYILHTDHSVPGEVEYGTYRHFLEHGLVLGSY